jgi:hypothetical protein
MLSKPLFIFMLILSLSCGNAATSSSNGNADSTIANTKGKDENPFHQVKDIPLPEGFTRLTADSNSFTRWLRDVVLKKDKTVFLFNETPKINQSAQFAVLDISVPHKDLQQCADAVMRLRAEYLFAEKRYNEMSFTDNEGHSYLFTAPFTRQNFMQYMEKVFGWCGSASLSKQLHPVSLSTVQSGDVLIRGGFPGHAVMVMDVATNNEGKKIYLLAQSYMPAQDIHILLNPMNDGLSPWYEVDDNELVQTPEYLFHRNELKRW